MGRAGHFLAAGLAGGEGPVGEKGEETEVDLWVLVVGAGVDGGGLVLALLKYPFYPLFILDNGMNLISKSLTVLTPA